ncbi:hypothetical protein [Rhodococcoides yunnanense]|uniref:Uncharacterized protein n=1 Tax=Rhodococcoides yunnanense TaxID=278209 RepID=A0ABU4BCP3_9NOCA|nr:hypothetical protein [Rhodococcus yunnanensis]MDV6261976.1 hypothetical protein [Rhodococcus yunnanensis]
MDDALTEIGMSAHDARFHMLLNSSVCGFMVIFLVVNRTWTWVPSWMLVFFVVVIAGSLWQAFRSPFERTAVYPDRLETRRRSGVVAVLAREEIESFRTKGGGDDGPSITAVGVDGKKTKLLGTDRVRTTGWANMFRSRRRDAQDLETQLENWKLYGSWE